MLCKSQVMEYLSVLWDTDGWASPFTIFFLQLLEPWLKSRKDNERERAMWCTARILGFTAKMEDFKVSGSLPWSLSPHTCLVALMPN